MAHLADQEIAPSRVAEMDLRPTSSPYLSKPVSFDLKDGTILHVPSSLLEKCPHLALICERSAVEEAHVLIHYLLTDIYQCLKPLTPYVQDTLAIEFTTSVRVYDIAREFELQSLEMLARKEMTKLSRKLPCTLVFQLIHKVYPSPDRSDAWLCGYLKNLLISFLEESAEPSKLDFWDKGSTTTSVSHILFKSLLELHQDRVLLSLATEPESEALAREVHSSSEGQEQYETELTESKPRSTNGSEVEDGLILIASEKNHITDEETSPAPEFEPAPAPEPEPPVDEAVPDDFWSGPSKKKKKKKSSFWHDLADAPEPALEPAPEAAAEPSPQGEEAAADDLWSAPSEKKKKKKNVWDAFEQVPEPTPESEPLVEEPSVQEPQGEEVLPDDDWDAPIKKKKKKKSIWDIPAQTLEPNLEPEAPFEEAPVVEALPDDYWGKPSKKKKHKKSIWNIPAQITEPDLEPEAPVEDAVVEEAVVEEALPDDYWGAPSKKKKKKKSIWDIPAQTTEPDLQPEAPVEEAGVEVALPDDDWGALSNTKKKKKKGTWNIPARALEPVGDRDLWLAPVDATTCPNQYEHIFGNTWQDCQLCQNFVHQLAEKFTPI